MNPSDIFTRLEQVIAQRWEEMPEGSYTTYLFREGQDKILKKVGEETAETIIASKNGNSAELVYEASDLLYHLLVLLRFHGIPFETIEAELERRHLPARAKDRE
jgi:phosphoribosyl-AMP cyclohydrolase / phosphoribosyl-ATP pyrophosphohydrolase